jgi:hypothetical protein
VWGYAYWSECTLASEIGVDPQNWREDRILQVALPLVGGGFYVVLTMAILFIAQSQDYNSFELWVGMAWLSVLVWLAVFAAEHQATRHLVKRMVSHVLHPAMVRTSGAARR